MRCVFLLKTVSPFALWMMGYCCLCMTLIQAEIIPHLPHLELQNFAAPIRQQVQKAYDEARARPRDAGASGRLAMLLQTYSQYEAAAVCYQRTRQLEPGKWKWTYYLGTVQAALGKHPEAAAALVEVVRRRPDYLAARLKLAESLFSMG
ncbi:MAG TPA: hypothetical protein VGQ81_14780, partial [Acidobacteriota bacterium]|nr:hypothetical protein [Acidobacteriota bacterium]